MRAWTVSNIGLIFIVLSGAGCKDPIDSILNLKELEEVRASVNKPSGRYRTFPSRLEITFSQSVDMESVGEEDFVISESCATNKVKIDSLLKADNLVSLSFLDSAPCADDSELELTIKFRGIEALDSAKRFSGKQSWTYTVDSTSPSVALDFGSQSQVSSSGNYAFSSIPSTYVYTFSSDVDLDTVSLSDFSVSSLGAIDCDAMPSISSLIKNATTKTATLSLIDYACGEAQSFRLSLAANSVGDVTRSSTTGELDPNLAPSSPLSIGIVYSTVIPEVVAVGGGVSSPDGRYGIGATLNLVVLFSDNVEVTGTPRLRLNLSGSRYATYVSGSGSNELLFQFTVPSGVFSGDLDYYSTSALQLNGGTISLSGSTGLVPATLTLPGLGQSGSLSYQQDLVVDGVRPTVISRSPSGAASSWGEAERTVSFTFSEEIDATSVDVSDLSVVPQGCVSPPTVTGVALSGSSNETINFTLSANSCADGEAYDVVFNPSDVSDLAGNAGSGSTLTLTVTTDLTRPTLSLGSPSRQRTNSSGTVTYVVSFSGASSISLADGDVEVAGAATDCTAVVTGSGLLTRLISISGCSSEGIVSISLRSGTAQNSLGNLAEAVAETDIPDFLADNTALTDPTDDFSVYNLNKVYSIDSNSQFELNFSGDVLGAIGNLTPTLGLQCDAGGGSTAINITVTRSSDTLVVVEPDETALDFVYASDCTFAMTAVPDAAGNVATLNSIAFKVGRTPEALSGPSGTLSISDLTTAGNLGSVVFNVPLDPATVSTSNVSLTCGGADIDVSSLNLSSGNTDILIDFDETDLDWLSLSGGETCQLTFTTNVTNSLSQPLTSAVNFTFVLTP